MKHPVRAGSVCLMLFALLSTAACAAVPASDTFKGGETVTPERLAEISAEVFTGTAPAEPPALPDFDPADPAFSGTVYWTAGGKVIHTDPACFHLNRAETLSGSVSDAVAAGKTGVCSVCQRRAGSAD